MRKQLRSESASGLDGGAETKLESALPQPAAAAVPSLPPPEPEAKTDEQQLVIAFGERRYRVRGLPKQLGEALKVNVLVTHVEVGSLTEAPAAEAGLHVDTFDLYQAKARTAFAKLASIELRCEENVIQHDLGRLLLKLEQVIEERAKATESQSVSPLPKMTAEETAATLAFLRDPKLLSRITSDFERVGLVGEPSNALTAYLACISRKLASPLAVLIQSTSAAGKSTLMDAVLALVPEEDRVHYSAMTGQSLFYLGEQEIKHRILAIAEEEGVRQAAYALKVLQSQGELTIASTGKDPATGHAGDPAVPGRGAGDAVPDYHCDRCRRGAGQPVSGAHDQRESRADTRDPAASASAPHARRPPGTQ